MNLDLPFHPLGLVAATAVLAYALRTFAHPLFRKTGALLILLASYLAGLFLFHSHLAGLAGVLFWFLFPWVELLTRIRRLRLPIHKKLRHVPPPSSHRFPALLELTDEVEAEGYEHVDDTGWSWEGMNQFYRLFYHPASRTEAAVCLTEQGDLSLAYLTLTTRDGDGIAWRTWNYPFSETMAIAPGLRLNPVPTADSFAELLDAHELFLLSHGLEPDALPGVIPEEIPGIMEEEIREQIAHNFSRGLIAPTDNNTFRYSWRGLLFLWTRFVKDMVRLS